MQPAPQRAGRNVEKPRRVRGVVAFEVDERDGFAQAIRQSAQRVLNHGAQLEPFQRIVGPRVRIGEVVGQSVRRGTTAVEFQARLAHDDCPQPGPEPVRIAQRLQPGQRLAERLGGGVFGGREFASHAKRRSSRRTPVAREQLADSGGLAPPRPIHQLPIRGFTHVIE